MTEPLLVVEQLSKSYGGVQVLDGLSFALAQGTLMGVRGENGAGKSTLLECLAGAKPIDAGTVKIRGRVMSTADSRYRRSVRSILDDFAWFPDLTVMDHYRLLDPTASEEDCSRLLARLSAGHLVRRRPGSLSSGQRQRCALASAGLGSWDILLVDEPERHLDPDGISLLGEFLASLTTAGRSVIAATHSAALIEGDQVHVLDLEVGRR